ncbi:hypothetical protein IEQ34_021029 [Dendrobium chrysotoxum]|uniref:Uncharacterized protein n=1 Tax=Dendrobium chrysotoxum TaxID=161865 RepID=A0AAV7G3Q5_DENCH|nr:hypothetical protein IEQ34_021029 [Dendrobium chrysotoxum]
MGILHKALDWRKFIAVPISSSISFAILLSEHSFDHFLSHTCCLVRLLPLACMNSGSRDESCIYVETSDISLATKLLLDHHLQPTVAELPSDHRPSQYFRPTTSCRRTSDWPLTVIKLPPSHPRRRTSARPPTVTKLLPDHQLTPDLQPATDRRRIFADNNHRRTLPGHHPSPNYGLSDLHRLPITVILTTFHPTMILPTIVTRLRYFQQPLSFTDYNPSDDPHPTTVLPTTVIRLRFL